MRVSRELIVENIKVFVSSTQSDLKAHREAIRQLLVRRQMHPIMMEDFSAHPHPAPVLCKQKVAESQLFIGIYANRYGYVPPANQVARDEQGVSITELEYLWASKAGLDHLVFILDEAYVFPPDEPIRIHADNDQRLKTFLTGIQSEVVWKKFTTPEDLALKVSETLTEWEKDPHLPKPKPKLSRLDAGLILLMLLLLLRFAWVLLRADPSLITILLTGVGLPTAVIAALSQLGIVLPTKDWRLSRPVLVLILALIVLVNWQVPPVLGQGKLDDLIRAAPMISSDSTPVCDTTTPIDQNAQRTLDSAHMLGTAMTDYLSAAFHKALLDTNYAVSTPRLLWVAKLLTYVDGAALQVIPALTTAIQGSAQGETTLETNELFRQTCALAILDGTSAGNIANGFNEQGVAHLATLELPNAIQMFSAVRWLDAAYLSPRGAGEKSFSAMNLGDAHYYQSILSGLPITFDEVESAYRDAISLDTNNAEAYYRLSAILIEHASDADLAAVLDEAVRIAQAGQQHTGIARCGSTQAAAAYLDEPAWTCFQLLTIEARARAARGDDAETILPLVTRAIELAEAQNQFSANQYTAEAYYYKMLFADAPDPETLCQVAVWERMPSGSTPLELHFSQKFVEWAREAFNRLRAQNQITACQR